MGFINVDLLFRLKEREEWLFKMFNNDNEFTIMFFLNGKNFFRNAI